MNLESTLKKLASAVALSGMLFSSSCAVAPRAFSSMEFEQDNDVIRDARRLSGIRHPGRYTLDVLEESNKNLTDTEYKKDLPLALFFFAEYDKPDPVFGILPLEFVAPKIADFIPGYKIMVFEATTTNEIKRYMERVAELYPQEGNIAGLALAGHGTGKKVLLSDDTKASKKAKKEYDMATKEGKSKDRMVALRNMMGLTDSHSLRRSLLFQVFTPYKKLFADDAIIFLGTCHGGKKDFEGRTYADAFAALFEGRTVYACDDVLTGFDYDLEDDHKVIPRSISLSHFVSDCTYVTQCTDECSFQRFMYAASTTRTMSEEKKEWEDLVKKGVPEETLELLAMVWPTYFRGKNMSDQLVPALHLKAFAQEFELQGKTPLLRALASLADDDIEFNVVTYYCHTKHTGELEKPEDILKRKKGSEGKRLYHFLKGPYCDQLLDFSNTPTEKSTE